MEPTLNWINLQTKLTFPVLPNVQFYKLVLNVRVTQIPMHFLSIDVSLDRLSGDLARV